MTQEESIRLAVCKCSWLCVNFHAGTCRVHIELLDKFEFPDRTTDRISLNVCGAPDILLGVCYDTRANSCLHTMTVPTAAQLGLDFKSPLGGLGQLSNVSLPKPLSFFTWKGHIQETITKHIQVKNKSDLVLN